MEDKYYGLYHIFESGLKKATSNTMCADLGYTAYESTVTHGFGPIKMTLDLYNPTPKEGEAKPVATETSIMSATETAEAQPCCNVCSDPQNKYYSIALGKNGDKHCGESCIQDKYYGLFHLLEKDLLKAESANPCKDHGYGVYSTTVTHGFGPIKVTLDLYNPDSKGMEVSEKALSAAEAPVVPTEGAKDGDATSPFVYIVPSFLGGVALAAAALVFGRKSEIQETSDSQYLLA